MEGTVRITGREVKYRGEVERFEIPLESGKIGATIYVTSYIRTDISADDRRMRPVMFAFNGGPGSSSVWTHLGLGPRRIADADTLSPRMSPPFGLVDNEESPLDVVDLVFLDPVGTGYSRPANEDAAEAFYGVEEDAQATLDVIDQWVRRHRRENSPRFLLGESYGTLRAARMARIASGGPFRRGLTRAGSVTGVITIGTHLVAGESSWSGDVEIALEFPTIVRTARFHGISSEVSDAEVQAFSHDVLLPALIRGTALSDDEVLNIADRMSTMTGLSSKYFADRRLRVPLSEFAKGALAGRHLGMYDSRFTLSADGAGEDPVADDPAMGQYAPQFAGLIERYLREELGCDVEEEYRAIDFRHTLQHWNYDGNPMPQSPAFRELQQVLRRNPRFEVLLGCGEFDLVTTAAATQFAVNRVTHDRERVHVRTYASGHMPYLGCESRTAFTEDLRRFVNRLSQPGRTEARTP